MTIPADRAACDRAALDRAAGLLNAVGRACDNSRVAIRCLLATDSLARAGADVRPTRAAVANPRIAIAAALRSLAVVDNDRLDDDVTDALQYALLAHAATS